MRCYYEELGVTRDSNDSEIKTAYRKLALLWHPDKNDSAEAKERFQVIQQAYEVLSDSQERSWYDKHREQILRGWDSDYEENCLHVFQFFTVSCYSGYGDDEKGFYCIYRQVFQQIAAEDAEFMVNRNDIDQIPLFGHSESTYDQVVGPFYAYWQSYITKKTYEWLCPYNIAEIKDRRMLREIEKEMKKIVQKAKKERNEEIRNLVSFVRKRDRRVHAYRRMLEERAEINRLKQEEKRLGQIKKRQKDLADAHTNHSGAFNTGYEEQLKQLELEYNSESDVEDSCDNNGQTENNEDVEYMNDIFCAACNKTFKNPNAFTNHEFSKRHRENVELLKKQMLEEEDTLKRFNDNKKELNEASSQVKTVNDDDKIPRHESSDKVKEEVVFVNESNKFSKKDKKNRKSNQFSALNESNQAEDVNLVSTQKSYIGSDNDDWGNLIKKGNRKSKAKKSSNIKKLNDQISLEPLAPKETLPPEDKYIASPVHVCATCSASFVSKNKLFTHLKKTNHGIYLPKANPNSSMEQKQKFKGKRKQEF